MRIHFDCQGRVVGARQVNSSHWDARPEGVPVSLLVVHGISLPPGQFGGPYIDQLFTGRLSPGDHPYFETIAGLRVSAHLLIRRGGELVQYVPLDKRAWHAGRSCFDGRERCNDYSIGIELEGTDDSPYTDRQYDCLVRVARALMQRYPEIVSQRIVGHADIAPGRKTDPGEGFDWVRFRRMLTANDSA
jgi:AmpD protein